DSRITSSFTATTVLSMTLAARASGRNPKVSKVSRPAKASTEGACISFDGGVKRIIAVDFSVFQQFRNPLLIYRRLFLATDGLGYFIFGFIEGKFLGPLFFNHFQQMDPVPALDGLGDVPELQRKRDVKRGNF